MDEWSSNKRRFRLGVRLVVYGVILPLAMAVALPNFVKARWESCCVPVAFKFVVADAQTGEPVAGAKTLVWFSADENWSINESSVGYISATTDARGICVVDSDFPGSGSGNKGQLMVNQTIWIRADGYEPWQQHVAALVGRHVNVSDPFRTNDFPLKIMMTRKVVHR